MKCWFIFVFSIIVLPVLYDAHSHKILFTDEDKIGFYKADTRNITIIASGLSNVDSIDFDYDTKLIFYVKNKRELYSMNLISKEIRTVLILPKKSHIRQIAVDWITKKIYFTDIETKRIEICQFDGSNRHVLFMRSVSSSPHEVAVSPVNGLMFYADAGIVPKLVRVNMDGSDSRVLVTENVIAPTRLKIDHVSKSVIWYEQYSSMIEIIQFDGMNRRMLLPRPRDIFDITVLLSRVYFTDYSEKLLGSCDLFNKSLCQVEHKGLGYSRIQTYGKENQPFVSSVCHIKNGGCSNLCLLKPNGHICACPTGLILLPDNRTCTTTMEKFVLFATKENLRIISLDVDEVIDQILPFQKTHGINAIDYDTVDHKLYWTDSTKDVEGIIMRASINGSGIETVVPGGYSSPDTLAVDWIARNLYWTCTELNKIFVSRLDRSHSAVIIDTDLDKPRGIAVDPADGRLYWSDWGALPKIEVADLDGKNRHTLISENLLWPNGIALDYKRRLLYWCDAGRANIEFYDLKLKTRYTLENKAGSPHPYSISVLGDHIYWTDWTRRLLNRLNVVTRELKVVIVAADIMGVKAIDTTFKYGNNACQINNNGCSHFCFHKPNNETVCGCPDGHQLDESKKGCVELAGYLLYATQRHINLLSLDPTQDATIPKIIDNEIVHLSTHFKSDRVFWVQNLPAVHAANAIKSTFLNNTEEISIVQTGFYEGVGGITVDWIGENLYWSQESLGRIEVSKLDGRYRRRLYRTKEHVRLTLLAVNPLKRKLYWFEVHETFSVLYASELDGTSRKELTNITGHPNGMTVDVNSSCIYWLSKDKIESINWDGSGKKIIIDSLGSAVGLTVFQDCLYFCEHESTESVSSYISSVDKLTGKRIRTVTGNKTEWFESIATFHDSSQLGENICERQNGGCQHLCFATSLQSRVCQCEMHYRIGSDNTSCIGPEQFILLSEKSVIYRVSLRRNEAEVPLHIPSDINVNKIDYNIYTEVVYWLDSSTDQIYYLNDSLVRTVDMGVDDTKVSSFAIDFLTNSLYWIDEVKHYIAFVNLDDSTKHGIIFSNENYHPSQLTILPERGLLFFVNVHPDRSYNSLESITFVGHLNSPIRKVKMPSLDQENDIVDLAVSYEMKRIFWLNSTEQTIWSSDLSGNFVEKKVAFNKIYRLVSIAVHDHVLYWIDEERDKNDRHKIERLKKKSLIHEPDMSTRSQITRFSRIYNNVNDLIFVDMKRKNSINPCKNNGGCSHICFVVQLSHDVSEGRCACPHGYAIPQNNSTHCELCPHNCNGICQPENTHCKKLAKCKPGLDDSQCSCAFDEIRCLSSTCIKRSAVCDGKHDCQNGEDEDLRTCQHLSNSTKTSIPPTKPLVPPKQANDEYSSYTAGIISGGIITTLIFLCILYVVCVNHHKKVWKAKKSQNICLEKTTLKFETDSVAAVVQPTEHHRRDLETFSESVSSVNYCDYRYITGSSVATESIMLPMNPPPSVILPSVLATSTLTLDMDSVSQIGMNECSYYESDDVPAPPATPVYVPSDIDSIATFDCGDRLPMQEQLNEPKRSCVYCRKNDCVSYRDLSLNSRQMIRCRSTAPSLVSSYLSQRRLSNNRATIIHNSIDSLNVPPLPRKACQFIGETDVVKESRLLPSLASEDSGSDASSIDTVREMENVRYEGYSDNYDGYPPPPSESDELFSSDMNDFTEFKDEEEEAFEIDFLLDSHRPSSSDVDCEYF